MSNESIFSSFFLTLILLTKIICAKIVKTLILTPAQIPFLNFYGFIMYNEGILFIEFCLFVVILINSWRELKWK